MEALRIRGSASPGDLIFTEAPSAIVQDQQNYNRCLCCACCGKILGDIDLHLKIACGTLTPQQILSNANLKNANYAETKENCVESILREYWRAKISATIFTCADKEDIPLQQNSSFSLYREAFCSEVCKETLLGKNEHAKKPRFALRKHALDLPSAKSKSLLLLANLVAKVIKNQNIVNKHTIYEYIGLPAPIKEDAAHYDDHSYALVLKYFQALSPKELYFSRRLFGLLLQSMEQFAWEFKAASPLAKLLESIVDYDLWKKTEVDQKLELLRAAILLRVGPVVKRCTELTEKRDVSDSSFAFAQRSQPVLVRRVLSQNEIKAIRKESAKFSTCNDLSEQERDSVSWKTYYLHTNNSFAKAHPDIAAKLVTIVKNVNDEKGWDLLDCRFTMRTVEHHIVKPPGSLPDPTHYDRGSLITIDIMLSDPEKDFEGGEFCTLEKDGMVPHRFEAIGDALVFISHKYHSIKPVLKGRREVLVVEFWKGEQRTCPHRCEQFEGPCCLYETSPRESQARSFKRQKVALHGNEVNSVESDGHYELEGSATTLVLQDVAEVASTTFEAYCFEGRALFNRLAKIQDQYSESKADENIEIVFESVSPHASVRAIKKLDPGDPLIF